MNIHTYGADARLAYCREYLFKERMNSAESIALLPIPTSKDGKTLNGGRENLEEIVSELALYDVVAGYDIPKSLRLALCDMGVAVVDVCRDEEYLQQNAELTAVGTVGRILNEEKAAPCDLSIGIIGYGRIGQRLLRLLMFLSCKVTVFTSKSEVRRELSMLGLSGADSLSLGDPEAVEKLAALDILINTAPVSLLGNGQRERLSRARIIELASGDNFPEGLSVERFASVPAFMYPKSAGIALGMSVIRMLGEGNSDNV